MELQNHFLVEGQGRGKKSALGYFPKREARPRREKGLRCLEGRRWWEGREKRKSKVSGGIDSREEFVGRGEREVGLAPRSRVT